MNPPDTVVNQSDFAGANALDHNSTAAGDDNQATAGRNAVWVTGAPITGTPPANELVHLDDPIDYRRHAATLAGMPRDHGVDPPLGGTPFGA